MNLFRISPAVIWLCAAIVLLVPCANAEVKVSVTPDRADWLYKVADPIEFTVEVKIDGKQLEKCYITWQIGPERMKPFTQGVSPLKNGKLILRSHGLDRPGFLRCIASISSEEKAHRGLATGAYEPERIEATTPMPDDFEAYWQNEIEKLKEIPLEPVLERDAEASTDKVDVYHISYNTMPAWGGSNRFYGMLAVPKGEGPFPALLRVPGAGIRPYRADTWWAERGVIHLSVGIHGIPVNLPKQLYDSLRSGALSNYPEFNLDDRERYYYRRVFLGCARAADFIYTQDKFDGKTLGIHGGSQGGALSIITAGLDKRFRFVAAAYPAMCDHFGYLRERAGGWPHLFVSNKKYNLIPEKLETAPYFDVVNFARILTVPVIVGFGFNDEACPPTSMFSAYNSIPSEKELKLIPAIGHQSVPELNDVLTEWLKKRLK